LDRLYQDPGEDILNFTQAVIATGLISILAACQPTIEAKPGLIGPDVEIPAPSAEVPADAAAFSGIWSEPPSEKQYSALAVQSIAPDGKVKAIYAWSDDPDSDAKAGSIPMDGQIDGGVLRLDPFQNGATASYALLPDGTLERRLERFGGVRKAVLTRQ